MTHQTDFGNRNIHPDFDDHINTKLGNYVYGLFEPGEKLPFYIGKGGGKASKGNQRVLHHFAEARSPAHEHAGEKAKIACIRAIWARGQDVEWRILSHGLNEDTALAVESALITTLNLNKPLTNIQGGHHGGLLASPAELYAWAAKPLDTATCPQTLHGQPIFLFNISRSFADRSDIGSAEESRRLAEDATRRAWRVSGHWRARGGIALGLVNGIARSAIRINGWAPASEDRRWEIVGPGLASPDHGFGDDEIAALVPRNFTTAVLQHCKGYWQRGNHVIFEIATGNTPSIHLLHGKAGKQPGIDQAA